MRISDWSSDVCSSDLICGHQPGGQEPPEGDEQLARQSDDGDAPHPAALVADPGLEPAAERAVRLMAQPQPGELDGDLPGPPVAGLAAPLLMVDPTAAPGRGGQPEIAAPLAPVLEVLPEQPAGPAGGEDRADTPQALHPGGGLPDL